MTAGERRGGGGGVCSAFCIAGARSDGIDAPELTNNAIIETAPGALLPIDVWDLPRSVFPLSSLQQIHTAQCRAEERSSPSALIVAMF